MSYHLFFSTKDSLLFSDVSVLPKQDAEILQNAMMVLAQAESYRDAQERDRDIARTMGYMTGLEEGRETASKVLAESTQAMTEFFHEQINRLRSDVAILALAIIRKMFGDADLHLVAAKLAKQALLEIPDENITVQVAPDATDVVENLLKAQTDRVTVTANPDLGPGDCLLMMRGGFIDAGFNTQLNIFEQALAQAEDMDD